MQKSNRNLIAGSRSVAPNQANAVAVLQKTKQKDGSYIISLPYNTSDEVLTNMKTGETLTDKLVQISNSSIGMMQDLSTLVLAISPFLSSSMKLNNLYRESFKTSDDILITTGTHTPGNLSGSGVSYQLKHGITKQDKPYAISIKDIKNIVLEPDFVDVYVTSNYNDTDPLWIDCTNEYLNGDIIPVPNDYPKEQDKPWNINIRFQYIGSDNIDISDLVIAYI